MDFLCIFCLGIERTTEYQLFVLCINYIVPKQCTQINSITITINNTIPFVYHFVY